MSSFRRLFKRIRQKALLDKINAAKKAQTDAKAAAEQTQATAQAAATDPVTTQPTTPPVQTTATPAAESDDLDLYINTMKNRRKRGAQLPDVAALLGQTATLGV